jgi:MinD superfamily P-loop ATPase
LPVAVIINKVDLNAANAARIRAFCEDGDIALVGELPFDDVVPESIGAATPLVEYDDGPVSQAIASSWREISEALMGNGH